MKSHSLRLDLKTKKTQKPCLWRGREGLVCVYVQERKEVLGPGMRGEVKVVSRGGTFGRGQGSCWNSRDRRAWWNGTGHLHVVPETSILDSASEWCLFCASQPSNPLNPNSLEKPHSPPSSSQSWPAALGGHLRHKWLSPALSWAPASILILQRLLCIPLNSACNTESSGYA